MTMLKEQESTYSKGSQVGHISCREEHVPCHIIHRVIQVLHSFFPAHLLIGKSSYELERAPST